MSLNVFTTEKDYNKVYKGDSDTSITSLSKIIDATTVVNYNQDICHLRSDEILDSKQYYNDDYILDIDESDKDSLYKVINGENIYRTEYQLQLFLEKLNINDSMNILDYGSAKGLFLDKLSKKKKIEPYLFDITKTYEKIWKKKFNEKNCSFYKLNPSWIEKFDIVSSFYVFEHVIDPIKELKEIYKALKNNGLVYLQVPYVYNHIADFICVDHIHHYSKVSLSYLLNMTGFNIIEIDTSSFDGAIIIIGQKQERVKKTTFSQEIIDSYHESVKKTSSKWNQIKQDINLFYNENKDKKSAIYGAGFYSTYILSVLPKKNNLQFAIDKNSFLHGKEFNGLKVISPSELAYDLEVLYVGLNPSIAKDAISEILYSINPNVKVFYISE